MYGTCVTHVCKIYTLFMKRVWSVCRRLSLSINMYVYAESERNMHSTCRRCVKNMYGVCMAKSARVFCVLVAVLLQYETAHGEWYACNVYWERIENTWNMNGSTFVERVWNI